MSPIWVSVLILLLEIVVSSGPAAVKSVSPAASKAVSASQQQPFLVINEYLADPPDGLVGDANGDGVRDSTADEFIEIVNVGAEPLAIGGFTISDSVQVRFAFPPSTTIPPEESAVVFGGGTPTGPFGNATANGLVFAAGGAGLSLNNSGDEIVIKDTTGIEIARRSVSAADGNANQSITRSPDAGGDFVRHSTAPGSGGAPFSPGTMVNGRPFTGLEPIIAAIAPESVPAGIGAVRIIVLGRNFKPGSLALINGTPATFVLITENELNLDVPPAITETPGSYLITVEIPGGLISNAVTFTVLAQLGINEFLADPPDGPSGDANQDGSRDSAHDEFIEIVNRGFGPVNVSGFSISDAERVRFNFPSGTVIPAGEAAVIFGGGAPRGEFGNAAANGLVFTAPLSLNNGGDTIVLKDPLGAIVEVVTFSSAEGNANQSINRRPDVLGPAFALHSALPEAAGRLFSPGSQASGSPFTKAPRVDRIEPARFPADNNPVTLVVRGSGFDLGSQVFIGFSPVETSLVDPFELAAILPVSIARTAGDYPVTVRAEGGNRSNSVILTIVPLPPVLLSVLPRIVTVGTGDAMLLLTGANFTRNSAVTFDDAPVLTTFLGERDLSARVSASLLESPGSRTIQVQGPDGQVSNPLSLEVVLPSPKIVSLSPPQVMTGNEGFTLSIGGLNFQEGAAILFESMPLETFYVSSSLLRADISPEKLKSPGLRSVSVVNPDGSISNDAAFRIVPIAPLLHGIDPTGVTEGAGTIKVALNGRNFQPGAVVRVVEEVQVGTFLRTSFLSNERLEAELPAELTAVAGRVLLRVENPDFGISPNAVFVVLIRDPLVINEYLADPPDGAAGDANGDGLRSQSQDEFIEIVNRTAQPIDISNYRISDADSIRHVFPAGTVVPPREAVVVFGGGRPTGGFGNAMENGLVFRASSGGLSLNNGGDTIRLEDAMGELIQEVRFGPGEGNANQALNRTPDVDGAVFSFHSRDPQANGRLFSPGVRITGHSFSIKPRIDLISPASARAGSHQLRIKVTGERFLDGATVFFEGTPVETMFVTGVELEAVVNGGLLAEGGARRIAVRNPLGEVSSGVLFRIVEDPPTISSVSPDERGTGSESTEIELRGERFQPGAVVVLSGAAIETTVVGRSLLRARVPTGFFQKAGRLELRIVNADENVSNTVFFTVRNGPLITRLPRRIKAGRGALEITIGGVAFQPGAVVVIGDLNMKTDFESEVELRASIPEDLTRDSAVLMLQVRNSDGGRSNMASLRVVE